MANSPYSVDYSSLFEGFEAKLDKYTTRELQDEFMDVCYEYVNYSECMEPMFPKRDVMIEMIATAWQEQYEQEFWSE